MIFEGECTLNHVLDCNISEEYGDKQTPFYIVSSGAIIGLEATKKNEKYHATVIASKDLTIIYKLKYQQLYDLTKSTIEELLTSMYEIQQKNMEKAYKNLQNAYIKKKLIKAKQFFKAKSIEVYENAKTNSIANSTTHLINELASTIKKVQYKPNFNKTKIILKSLDLPLTQKEDTIPTRRKTTTLIMNIQSNYIHRGKLIRNHRKDYDYSNNNISTNTFTNTSMNIRMNTSIGANTRNIGTSTDDRTYNYGTDRGKEIKSLQISIFNQPLFHFRDNVKFRRPSYNTGSFSIPLLTQYNNLPNLTLKY